MGGNDFPYRLEQKIVDVSEYHDYDPMWDSVKSKTSNEWTQVGSKWDICLKKPWYFGFDPVSPQNTDYKRIKDVFCVEIS